MLLNGQWSGNQITSGTWDLEFNFGPLIMVAPSSLGWNSPYVAWYTGEQQGTSNQSPGVENAYAYNPVAFSSVEYLNGYSGTWASASINGYMDQATWQVQNFQQYVSSDLFYIWDNRQNPSFK